MIAFGFRVRVGIVPFALTVGVVAAATYIYVKREEYWPDRFRGH